MYGSVIFGPGSGGQKEHPYATLTEEEAKELRHLATRITETRQMTKEDAQWLAKLGRKEMDLIIK